MGESIFIYLCPLSDLIWMLSMVQDELEITGAVRLLQGELEPSFTGFCPGYTLTTEHFTESDQTSNNTTN